MPLAAAQAYYGMNKELFDKLTPRTQKAIVDASTTMEQQTKDMTMKALAAAMEEMKTKMKGLYTPTLRNGPVEKRA